MYGLSRFQKVLAASSYFPKLRRPPTSKIAAALCFEYILVQVGLARPRLFPTSFHAIHLRSLPADSRIVWVMVFLAKLKMKCLGVVIQNIRGAFSLQCSTGFASVSPMRNDYLPRKTNHWQTSLQASWISWAKARNWVTQIKLNPFDFWSLPSIGIMRMYFHQPLRNQSAKFSWAGRCIQKTWIFIEVIIPSFRAERKSVSSLFSRNSVCQLPIYPPYNFNRSFQIG